ncbi:arginine/serine-rich coiled-coil protein 2 isoform X3 [Morus notabilis]|nr:arginine/serine-rich coiled-coil protein 2 isoform X3 [Morus notabilis]
MGLTIWEGFIEQPQGFSLDFYACAELLLDTMDSNLQSPNQDNVDVKPAFRKPTTDATNRKYRRHSPVSGSQSDGSPERERSASPKLTGEDPRRVHESQSRRKDDGKEVDRDSYRSHYGRGSDSYRHSDRQFSRSSHRYSRHDDYSKHDKHADDEERNHRRLSSRSGWESKGGTHIDHSKLRDHLRDGGKYSRDRYDSYLYNSKDRERETSSLEHHKYNDRDSSFDKAKSGKRHPHPEDVERERRGMEKDGQDDKRDFRRSSGDYRGDREEVKGHSIDFYSRNRAKECYKNEAKEIDGQCLTKEGKKKYDDVETNRSNDQYIREPAEQSGEKSVIGSENQEFLSKRQKFSLDKYTDAGKKVSKFSTVADVKESSPQQPPDHKLTAGEDQVNVSNFANDLNAAKVAAMKAAESVNKNLVGGVGTGFMTADQKKKLLWGNKKTTIAEESGHRWDSTLFSDRERQEKFNKLMGVKADQKADHKPENQSGSDLLQAEKQRELQLDLEKQYTAGLRRRDGRTVGLGL